MAISKAKTRKKQARRSSTRKKSTPPWVWLLIGLILGLVAALAVYLYVRADGKPATKAVEPAAQQKAVPATKKKVQPAQTRNLDKPRFDFYRLLPEREIIIPEEQIANRRDKKTAPIPDADKGGHYLLQAGAFKTFKQADQLKARLALIGVEANIETVKINDAVAWHRVRVGPFSSLDKVNTVRYRLQDNDIETVVLKVN